MNRARVSTCDDTILIYDDTVRSPDLRRVIPHAVPDRFLYVEHDACRHVVVRALEMQRMSAIDGLEVHSLDMFGRDELLADGANAGQVEVELCRRVCDHLGVRRARTPFDFPLTVADYLREHGVELLPSPELFATRRRSKTPEQLTGIRRAQLAADTAVAAVAELLRAARVANEAVVLDGEPLTCERLKVEARAAIAAHGASADEFIIAHGAQTCIGHHMGSGAILAGEPITVDIWPRDEQSGCYTDMTRTFVVGEPSEELLTYHALCLEAIEKVKAAIKPGVTACELHALACEGIEAAGYPTLRTKPPGTPLLEGFFHGLGHGVGLDVHEAPVLDMRKEPLVEGDVIAVEPGCYRQGYGGARLEDTIVVHAGGGEPLTHFSYNLQP
jgi:Xaa-Pro aminopeptidase